MATEQQTRANRGRSPRREQERPTRPSGQRRPATHRDPGESDEIYGLVSVLYHALQGQESSRKYIEDARRMDDDELVEFFEECQDHYDTMADRAKALLLGRTDEDEGGLDEEDDEDERADSEDEDEDEDT